MYDARRKQNKTLSRITALWLFGADSHKRWQSYRRQEAVDDPRMQLATLYAGTRQQDYVLNILRGLIH